MDRELQGFHSDLFEWLNNLEKYSGIKGLRLTNKQIEDVWEFLGGSCWEIQSLLSDIMSFGFDAAIARHRKERIGEIKNAVAFNSVS